MVIPNHQDILLVNPQNPTPLNTKLKQPWARMLIKCKMRGLNKFTYQSKV